MSYAHGSPSAETAPAQAGGAIPERIAQLANGLVAKMKHASAEISKVNGQTRLLSFNAQIEAARAGGPTGAAFGVVASAMRDLSDRTSAISDDMGRETAQANAGLQQIIQTLGTLTADVRGTRLADLALTNIDLVDRNLYERSCDVRWWATDGSGVEALTQRTEEAYLFCARRYGVILSSYTVYYDLVLCDLEGRVVASGRPQSFRSQGTDCSRADWFRTALATRSGEEFGFQGVHQSLMAGGQRALIYSCCVRAGGEVQGKPLGVLGVVFNWDALAQVIVHATPPSADGQQAPRTCLVDDAGLVLADSHDRALQDTLALPDWGLIKRTGNGYYVSTVDGRPCLIGYAASPGYETYATGWHSLLIQETG